jgi:hypothetical protein
MHKIGEQGQFAVEFHAVVAARGHRTGGVAQPRSICLAFVGQDVGLVHDDERRRQPLELLLNRAQRGRECLRAPLDSRRVCTPRTNPSPSR